MWLAHYSDRCVADLVCVTHYSFFSVQSPTPVTMKKFTEWKNVGGTCKLAEVEVKGYVINFLDGLKVNNEQFHKMCHISFRPCYI